MSQKAWIISVNMGYGHQRTAFPLKDLASEGKVINANDYRGIPEKDRKIWEASRQGYELISRIKRIPLIGEFLFFLFDRFQKILIFYPKRDLSKPTLQLKQIFSLIGKGWGKHLIESLRSNSGEATLPVVSTFFIPVFMAEHFNYPGEIFCVVCDADISRTWASLSPKESKIKYFVPNQRVAERLKLYGVKPENIFLTGYPLPLENMGHPPYGRVPDLEVLKEDLKFRLLNLDPNKRYLKLYDPLIKKYLGDLPEKSDHPLTLMFAVGGAGAQKEIGVKIVKSLSQQIKSGRIKIILVAGIREKVKDYFEKNIKNLPVEIIFGKEGDESKDSSSPSLSPGESSAIEDYFQKFNQALRKTDILWTKPSELSFYSALGIPIIIAPTIGSQEEFNKRWLLKSGFGLSQENPKYANQWLFDWIENGYLAEAAMQGFVEGEKMGTFKIKEIISKCLG